MKPLVMVAGLPSSGTSLVAGLLHHLGCRMGRVPTIAEHQQTGSTRPYLGYECLDFLGELQPLRDVQPSVLLTLLRRYIQRRQHEPTPIGIKHNVLSLLGLYDEVTTLPLQIVHVQRDLAETFSSDIKYKGYNFARAGWRGQLHLGLTRLLERLEPTTTIDFEEARVSPYLAAVRLKRTFALDGDPDAAVQAVNASIWSTEVAV